MSSSNYTDRPKESDIESLATSAFLSEDGAVRVQQRCQWPVFRRFTVTEYLTHTCAFMIGMILMGTLLLLPDRAPYGHYESGFSEESILPREAIQLEQRRYTGELDFRMDGTQFIVMKPGDKDYVGNATKEIDDNWEELLWGRSFSISETEAKQFWGEDHELYRDHDRSGYTGLFDMFHQLHCLDKIRQALRPDVYHPMMAHGAVHTAHCIDALRQSIMCSGSTAIVPLKFYPGYNHSYVSGDILRTCRKWQPIRDYVSARFNGSLAVPRPNGYVSTVEMEEMMEHAFPS